MVALIRIVTLSFLDRFREAGLLLLRLGIGGLFVFYHGPAKMFGGPEVWAEFGKVLPLLGADRIFTLLHIPFSPVFWGFMAAFAEFVGGILLILGLCTRLAAVLMLIDMAVASSAHLVQGQGFAVAAHPVALGIVFLSLIVIGSGCYSLDELLNRWVDRHSPAPAPGGTGMGGPPPEAPGEGHPEARAAGDRA